MVRNEPLVVRLAPDLAHRLCADCVLPDLGCATAHLSIG
jgi:hypothetical protein